MLLTEEEVRALTGKSRHKSQVEALRGMGIEHKIRPNGSVAVLRSHAEDVMGAKRVPAGAEFTWGKVR